MIAKPNKKKAAGARLWIKFDRFGQSEVHEWDKNAIIRRASIPARDLRILGPVFSQSSNILDLEKNAYPVLDELARDVSTTNLELVRSLKSNLTRLLAPVQKVRDEIEHLLDGNEDMAHLYLTRKWMQNQQYEALMTGTAASNNFFTNLRHLNSNRSGSIVTSNHFDDHDVEDLEMLLEAHFMQLDGTRNKILYENTSMIQRTMSTSNSTTIEMH